MGFEKIVTPQLQSVVFYRNFDTGLVFDLSKIFDTFDYQILVAKLEIYNFLEAAILHVENYLANRFQFIRIGNISASPQPIAVTRCAARFKFKTPFIFYCYQRCYSIGTVFRFYTLRR